MHKPKRPLLICPTACAALLALLAGCATPMLPDVGAVVVAPRVQLPAPPVIVQQTLPKPEGYFQQSFLDYFSPDSVKPTTSTPPTPAAVQTRTP